MKNPLRLVTADERDTSVRAMGDRIVRPAVTELRLTGFKTFRRAVLPLAPLTVLCGPSGAGKSNAMDGLEVLSRLALGDTLSRALGGDGLAPTTRPIRGGLAGCAPHGRRGFLLGCTVRTRHGPIRLDLAVQLRPQLSIVRERLTGHGRILLETLRTEAKPGSVHVAWHSDGPGGQIRASLAADRLLTSQLPLRVAGATEGERLVSMAAEEVLVALRGVYPSEPVPQLMRAAGVPGDGMLRRHADNIAPVVERVERECRFRHARLFRAVRSISPQPVHALRASRVPEPDSAKERVEVGFDEGELGYTTLAGSSDGLLRFLAFAAVLLTGPGVLQMDPVEVPDTDRLLTVLAEDFDGGMAPGQRAALLALAGEMCAFGHVRVLAAAHEPRCALESDAAAVVHCRRDPATGYSLLSEPVGPGAAPHSEEPSGPVRLSDAEHPARATRTLRVVSRMPGRPVRPVE